MSDEMECKQTYLNVSYAQPHGRDATGSLLAVLVDTYIHVSLTENDAGVEGVGNSDGVWAEGVSKGVGVGEIRPRNLVRAVPSEATNE